MQQLCQPNCCSFFHLSSSWSTVISLVTGHLPGHQSSSWSPVIFLVTSHLPGHRSSSWSPVIFLVTGHLPGHRSSSWSPVIFLVTSHLLDDTAMTHCSKWDHISSWILVATAAMNTKKSVQALLIQRTCLCIPLSNLAELMYIAADACFGESERSVGLSCDNSYSTDFQQT